MRERGGWSRRRKRRNNGNTAAILRRTRTRTTHLCFQLVEFGVEFVIWSLKLKHKAVWLEKPNRV